MTDIVGRLHTIRAHLRTGALGQREVWENWLTEAGSEIERLKLEVAILRTTESAEIERLTAALQVEPKP